MQWDALPSLALANIFCRISIKDRSHNIPFVSKSWAHAASNPLCWASMIAQNYSLPGDSAADHAFVLDSYPYSFVDPFDGRRSPSPHHGLASLQALIERAGGGAVVTSVYFFPFLTSAGSPTNDNEIIRLIAKHCPNLKHISFHGSYNASQETILELIHNCRNLELVDFSDSPYFNSLMLEELSRCCPNIRGIRRNGLLEPSCSYVVNNGFPCLKFLNISNSSVHDRALNMTHRIGGFYPFGGLYDDNDFIDSDTDDDYGDDDDDTDDDDDNDEDTDDDDDDDGNCDSHDNITDHDDKNTDDDDDDDDDSHDNIVDHDGDYSGNEVLNEDHVEEEDNGGNDSPDTIVPGETDDDGHLGSDNEVDNIGEPGIVSDDSFSDIFDVDDYSDSECGGEIDFDDCNNSDDSDGWY